jgi:outer membrane lipoprotein LolB
MIRRASLVGALLLASGCVHQTLVDDGLNFSQRQTRLATLTDWSSTGRINIDTGQDSASGRVTWQQQDDRLRLEIRGFLGARSFRIEGDPQALVVTERGEAHVLTDPELELSDMFGWWLPVTSLRYWLLGRADPEFPSTADRGPGGTLAALDQRSWHIDYEEYQLATMLLVPRRLTLSYRSLVLKLLITDWQPAVEEP